MRSGFPVRYKWMPIDIICFHMISDDFIGYHMKELFLQTILAFLAINFCGILRLAVSFFLCYIIIAKPLAERRPLLRQRATAIIGIFALCHVRSLAILHYMRSLGALFEGLHSLQRALCRQLRWCNDGRNQVELGKAGAASPRSSAHPARGTQCMRIYIEGTPSMRSYPAG